jgi:hypothetical protein
MLSTLRRLRKAWLRQISGAPDLFLMVGIVCILIFGAALSLLLISILFNLQDKVASSDFLMRLAIGFCSAFLFLGGYLVFSSLRNSTMPGTLLFRLTHFDWRKR